MTTPSGWHALWKKKGTQVPAASTKRLADLIRADGFDSGPGDHSIDSWQAFSGRVIDRMNLMKKESVLEVGCGSGAFLWPIVQLGNRVFGVDYSHSLIKIATQAIPSGGFVTAEAQSLPLPSNLFDVTLTHSMLQYLPDLDSAKKAVEEMFRVSTAIGKVAILDVNDASKEALYLEERRALIKDYDEKYKSYPHQFYQKEWFYDLGRSLGVSVNIEHWPNPDYANSKFRFHVFLNC